MTSAPTRTKLTQWGRKRRDNSQDQQHKTQHVPAFTAEIVRYCNLTRSSAVWRQTKQNTLSALICQSTPRHAVTVSQVSSYWQGTKPNKWLRFGTATLGGPTTALDPASVNNTKRHIVAYLPFVTISLLAVSSPAVCLVTEYYKGLGPFWQQRHQKSGR